MQLPARVFEKNGAYHLDLGRIDGKRKSKKLSRVAEGESALWDALARATRPGGDLMSDLFDDFIKFGMVELAESTRGDYRGYIARTLRPKFGAMRPEDLTQIHVAQLLELRKKQGARVVANREIACLSSVFQYAMRHGRAQFDPTRGVRRNKEKPRDRYARHAEFLRHFEASPEWLQDILAGIYLMELRPGDARRLPRTAIREEGIVIEETKRGKVKVIKWSPALSHFVTRSLERGPKADVVFVNGRGDPVTKWAMASAMARLRKKLGLTSSESFRFHDIRAKGESDHRHGGHELLTIYKRAKVFTPVN